MAFLYHNPHNIAAIDISHDQFMDLIILCLPMKMQGDNTLAIKYNIVLASSRYFFIKLLVYDMIDNLVAL